MAVQGYGMPNMRDNRFRGRMLLQLEITIPNNLNPHQVQVLRQLFP